MTPHISEIQHAVAQHFGVTMLDMVSACRAQYVARPRQVAMYLSRELTPYSLPMIGRKFGGRDHTTVMHACKRIEELMTFDPEIADAVGEIRVVLTRAPDKAPQDSAPAAENTQMAITIRPHGCICPPGAEKTCQGIGCPRRHPLASINADRPLGTYY